MEMDMSSVIIGAVAITICAMPFIMMNRSKNKREQKFLDSLSKLASENNCKIDHYEIFGNFAIGIDETKKIVLFCRQTKDKMKEQAVNCTEMRSCKIINTSRMFNNSKIIDKLELSLMPITKNRQEITLTFYKAKVSSQLYGELQSIEKWSKLINQHLTN